MLANASLLSEHGLDTFNSKELLEAVLGGDVEVVLRGQDGHVHGLVPLVGLGVVLQKKNKRRKRTGGLWES